MERGGPLLLSNDEVLGDTGPDDRLQHASVRRVLGTRDLGCGCRAEGARLLGGPSCPYVEEDREIADYCVDSVLGIRRFLTVRARGGRACRRPHRPPMSCAGRRATFPRSAPRRPGPRRPGGDLDAEVAKATLGSLRRPPFSCPLPRRSGSFA